MPIVDESVAILSAAQRRQLLATLDRGKRPGSRQKAGAEPALLYGLIRCGTCSGLMYRATAASKYRQYRCQHRACAQQVSIARDAVEAYVVDETLSLWGHKPVVLSETVDVPVDAQRLADIEAAIQETARALTEDEADVALLAERLAALKEARSTVRTGASRSAVFKVSARPLATLWDATDDVEEHRQLLLGRVDEVRVGVGGGRGRGFDPARVSITWRQRTENATAREDIMLMRHWTAPLEDPKVTKGTDG
jgi:site-specific DNA recombinase